MVEYMLSAIGGAIQKGISGIATDQVLKLTTKIRIKYAAESAAARIIEPLEEHFRHEGLTEEKQKLLIDTCLTELQPALDDAALFAKADLSGEKLFEQTYPKGELPRGIRDEKMDHYYRLIFPRIAQLVCQSPVIAKEWEKQAWAEGFTRLTDLAATLGDIGQKVDALASGPVRQADELLVRVKQTVLQKAAFDVDLTGLRSQTPQSATMEQMFVLPNFIEARVPEKQKPLELLNDADHARVFFGARRRNVVFGPPGAGKSTWSRWLQQLAIQQHGIIALVIRLRTFPDGKLPSLETLLKREVGENLATELTSAAIRQWLDKGKILLILDGFDEVAPALRDTFLDSIHDLELFIKDSPLLVTSRPLTTKHLDDMQEDWMTFEVQPFTNDQIIDYITRWHRHMPQLSDAERTVNAADLAKEWQGEPTVAPLTGNPLMLATLLMVHHLDGKLPSGRARLYDRYVEGMLGLWDDRRQVPADGLTLNADQKRRLLTRLAIYFHLHERDQLNEEEIEPLLKPLLDEMGCTRSVSAVLGVLRERSGLLIGPGAYSFIHKSVGEFLVGQAIVDGNQRAASGEVLDRFYLLKNRYDDRWAVVLLFYIGLCPIADLQAFLDECVADASYRGFSTAIILLGDQSHRLDSTVVRQFLIAAYENSTVWALPEFAAKKSAKSGDMFSRDTHVLSVPWMPRAKEADSETLFLLPQHSIGGVQCERSLSALENKVLLPWNDLPKMGSLLRNWIRASRIHSLIDDTEWTATVLDKQAISESTDFWRYYGFHWIAAVMNEKRISPSETRTELLRRCRVYAKTFLELEGCVPLMALASALDRVGLSAEHGVYRPENVASFVSAVLELRSWKIAPEVLALTKSFDRCRWFSSASNSGDILEGCPQLFGNPKVQRLGIPQEDVKALLEWLAELKLLRDGVT